MIITQNSVTELKRYEDDNHFEISLAVDISAKDITELEFKALNFVQILQMVRGYFKTSIRKTDLSLRRYLITKHLFITPKNITTNLSGPI